MKKVMKKIFIAQSVLDSMFEQEKAHLEQDKLMIHSKQNQIFKLTPAFKFLYVSDGSADPHQFVGKIFTKQELDKIDVDLYMDSAIYKDTAYQVDPGYVGMPLASSPAQVVEAPETPIKPKEEGSEPKAEQVEEASDQDLLSDYLLKIL